MSFGDRPYQAEAVQKVFERFEDGEQSTLLVMATGTGKTVVATKIATRAKEEFGWRTMFIAHREELITQAAATFEHAGLEVGIEMANLNAQADAFFDDHADVVVGTVQTLQGARLQSWPKDHFGLLIIDEAHHARAKSYRHVIDHFDCRHLGITATPDRGDGKNLGAVYQSIAFDYELVKASDCFREGGVLV